MWRIRCHAFLCGVWIFMGGFKGHFFGLNFVTGHGPAGGSLWGYCCACCCVRDLGLQALLHGLAYRTLWSVALPWMNLFWGIGVHALRCAAVAPTFSSLRPPRLTRIHVRKTNRKFRFHKTLATADHQENRHSSWIHLIQSTSTNFKLT